jgi:molecular chaperone GrpE
MSESDPKPDPTANAASNLGEAQNLGQPPESAFENVLDLSEFQARIAELEAQETLLKDGLLRAKAEAENARRRGAEEATRARKFAIDGFAESLLPVRDSLEAALINTRGAPDKLLEGVETTLRQLTSAFERNGLIEISPAAGTKFDPHQHQAISAVPSEQNPNTIVSVLQKGYLLADRVVRPAMVMVSAPPAA